MRVRLFANIGSILHPEIAILEENVSYFERNSMDTQQQSERKAQCREPILANKASSHNSWPTSSSGSANTMADDARDQLLPPTGMGRKKCCIKFGCQRRSQRKAMLTEKHQNNGQSSQRLLPTAHPFPTLLLLFMLTFLIGVNCDNQLNQPDNEQRNSFNLEKAKSGNLEIRMKDQLSGARGLADKVVVSSHQTHDQVGDRKNEETIRNNNNELKQRGTSIKLSKIQRRQAKNLAEISTDKSDHITNKFLPSHGFKKEANKSSVVSLEHEVRSGPVSSGKRAAKKAFAADGHETVNHFENSSKRANKVKLSSNDSSLANNLEERIEIKPKFTFTVNSKELPLESPNEQLLRSIDDQVHSKSAENVAAKDSGTVQLLNAGESRKVNRIGEFISPDYESGFDTNSELESVKQANSNSATSNINKHYPAIPTVTTKVGRFSASILLPAAPSSSSSLMSPSLRLNGNIGNTLFGDEANVADLDAPPKALLSSGDGNTMSRFEFERNEARGPSGDSGDYNNNNSNNNNNDNDNNKIISDWPKASAPLASIDRHSISSGNAKSQNQPSRFSKLLNGNGNGDSNGTDKTINEAARQQVSSSAPNKASAKLAMAKATTNSADAFGAPHDNGLNIGNGNGNVKRNQQLAKVSVYVKNRSAPSTSAAQLSENGKSFNAQLDNGYSAGSSSDHSLAGGSSNTSSHRPFGPTTRSLTASRLDSSMHMTAPLKSALADIQSSMTAPTLSGSGSNSSLLNSYRGSLSRPQQQVSETKQTSSGSRKFTPDRSDSIGVELIKSNTTSSTTYSRHSMHSTLQQKMDTQSTGDEMDKRPVAAATETKSRIVTRDLSHKLHPLSLPSGALQFQAPNRIWRQDILPSPFVNQISNQIHRQSPNLLTHETSMRLINDTTIPFAFLPPQNQQETLGKVMSEQAASIVRTGPIFPHPLGLSASQQSELRALMPAAVALLAQAREDQHSRASNHLRALLANQQHMATSAQGAGATTATQGFFGTPQGLGISRSSSLSQNLSGADQMVATANHLGVSHLGPQSMPANLGTSESNNYNSIQDYSDRSVGGSGADANSNGASDSNLNSNTHQQTGNPNMMSEDQRHNINDFQNDLSSFDQISNIRNQAQNTAASTNTADQAATTNSRSSMADVYLRAEHKSRDSAGPYPLRSSMDPFEDMSSPQVTSEYEKDLADLDEEFNRHTSYRRPINPLMSDSYISLSPERYESRRYNRRPSYEYAGGEIMSSAGSMSSVIPRTYQRSPAHWSSGSSYGDSSDLWTDSNMEFSPLASLVSPSHYTYRWRPRYQRLSPNVYSSSAYLTPSASEQHLQPAYNIIPSYTSAMPTETISFALSPLAAAAAAAASALAAADKSRHHNHGWLTLPRLAANTITPQATTASSAASQAHGATIPGALQAAYIQRPNPYALGSMPFYAIAPRPAAPLTTAASGVAPSIYPYFPGAAPTIIAYRPASVVPSSSLLAAASYAYPLRLPVAHIARPPSTLATVGSGQTRGRHFYSDLQFAETKPKTNLTNSSDSKGLVKAGTLTAMARNLTKKMFGSASQIRPQHVAPPNTMYDVFSSTQNASSIGLNLSAPI